MRGYSGEKMVHATVGSVLHLSAGTRPEGIRRVLINQSITEAEAYKMDHRLLIALIYDAFVCLCSLFLVYTWTMDLQQIM